MHAGGEDEWTDRGRGPLPDGAVAWAVALRLTASLIAMTHFTSRDNDSFLYAGISARLSQLPVAQWIAPEWWGFWTLHGPYCEHPVGLFVLPAALGRLGYPPEQAAYAVNAAWQAAAFILASLIAGFSSRRATRARSPGSCNCSQSRSSSACEPTTNTRCWPACCSRSTAPSGRERAPPGRSA